MPIKQFELFHGAVLTKLVRGGGKVKLTLIETRPRRGDASTPRLNLLVPRPPSRLQWGASPLCP